MIGLIAQTHWDSTRTLALAALLLAGGAALIAGPRLGRWWQRVRGGRSARPATIDERVACIDAAAKAHADLDRVVREAREVIRAGCEQLDSRLAHLERLLARIDEMESKAAPGGTAAPPARQTPTPHAVGQARAQPDAAAMDPLSRQVFALADAGKSSLQIAQETGQQIGKIDLMLALRRV